MCVRYVCVSFVCVCMYACVCMRVHMRCCACDGVLICGYMDMLCVCVCVYMHRAHGCADVCVFGWIWYVDVCMGVFVGMRVCMCACLRVCMYACICVRVYACVHVLRVYANMCDCVCVYMRCVCVCMCVCVCALSCVW